ncbi:hypothetical protein ACIRRH_40545 [Kitasatospora sp. NPDC101235]
MAELSVESAEFRRIWASGEDTAAAAAFTRFAGA